MLVPRRLFLRRHDLRWLRLHPQLLGADAARGWTKLVEHVDVPLADAAAATELFAREQPRLHAITDGQTRCGGEPAEDRGRSPQVEAVVGGDGQDVALREAVAHQAFPGELGMIEEA